MKPTQENLQLIGGLLKDFMHLPGVPQTPSAMEATIKSICLIFHNKTGREIFGPMVNWKNGRAEWTEEYSSGTECVFPCGPDVNDIDWTFEIVRATAERFPLPVHFRKVHRNWPPTDEDRQNKDHLPD